MVGWPYVATAIVRNLSNHQICSLWFGNSGITRFIGYLCAKLNRSMKRHWECVMCVPACLLLALATVRAHALAYPHMLCGCGPAPCAWCHRAPCGPVAPAFSFKSSVMILRVLMCVCVCVASHTHLVRVRCLTRQYRRCSV